MLSTDTLSKVLYIDLEKRSFWIEDRSDLFKKYFGGAGVAIHLLTEECPKGADPLSPQNPIILATGPLVGVFPMASKTVAMFKSPLTGDLGESHAGGRSSVALRLAGFGAIVIRNASDIPVWLSIHDNRVYFKDASSLWGMASSLTPAHIIREREEGVGYRSIMRIGPAGENLISYAAVTTETYRHFGRMGLGAVFGSKKLKAIIIYGKQSLKVTQTNAFRRLYSRIFKEAISYEVMKKYHDIGTAVNVETLNLLKALPTKNLLLNSYEKANVLSGEYIARHYLGRRVACAHCPIACIHLANLRENYKQSPYFYTTSFVGYDYEVIYALGTMLCIESPEDLFLLTEDVEKYCLDAISTGVILAWATEMMEKNLITTKETEGIELKWGDVNSYRKFLFNIVYSKNQFYHNLSRGVEFAAEFYGGKDFALAYNRNEMPGYHTGVAAHLGYIISARHSHLCNAGYTLDQTKLLDNDLSPQQIVDSLIEEEIYRQILSSMVVCFFARGIYTYQRICDALAIMGFDTSIENLKQIGKEIHKAKYKFKFREGFSFDNIRIPKRIFETSEPTGKLNENFLRQALEYAKQKLTIDR